ncbi:hypothetical protein GCM10011415_06570 [Salipiger pallidus]|uniref:Helix-turn-helix domain-containing protein n=1 Tax=Salipiger pallidus TaxID=1775170 RepID=A0A8J2ZH52_9RHOB|nr:hypothetical protein [Salipiger pallidus]GGG62865.1 hypothetical protein GCM10011415_06570 [Salipiger pallidus]
MGRDKKNEKRREHFAQLKRHIMQEPAWRALRPVAQALYPWLLLEWHGGNANNNGDIQLSTRQAADCLGVNRNTAAGAFHDLQAKGFIVVTKPAQLGSSGNAKSPSFELTEIALPTATSGRRLYKNWTQGADFPVKGTSSNNPRGRNGKEKPRHENRDRNVLNFVTSNGRTS